MNIQIITSSYPAYPDDPSGTAGLFVRAFALELQKQGHRVVVHPVARKREYEADAGLIVEPLPWLGGDRELASLSFWSPYNWLVVLAFFRAARKKTFDSHRQHGVDRTLCMWAFPSGLLGFWLWKATGNPYDVWALGSDIWRMRKFHLLGPRLLRTVLVSADRIFADGHGLSQDVEEITGRPCQYLPSSRVLPQPRCEHVNGEQDLTSLLFVGRYHYNKGPDLLIQAFCKLPEAVRRTTRLDLYGIGPLKSTLLTMVKELQLAGQVSIHDGINAQELSDRLSCSDFLVIPSRIESVPVVFSDALQMSVPVIALPVGDLPQLIADSDCGILADDCSPEALAEAIEYARSSRKKECYAENARALARAFRVEAAVKKWLPGDDGIKR